MYIYAYIYIRTQVVSVIAKAPQMLGAEEADSKAFPAAAAAAEEEEAEEAVAADLTERSPK